MKDVKDVRPTSGRVLSALFSIIGDRVRDSSFLDLFAGTGRVGLEALKRGAASCVFVESVKSRAALIREQCDSLVLALEVRRALSWLVKRDMKFDIVFADPPYNSGWCEVLPTLGLERVLAKSNNALLVIEHSIREKLSHEQVTSLSRTLTLKDYEYGETCLTLIRSINRE